jgi:bilirubin oxidase
VNVYKGLAGMYKIVDSALDASLGIPSGSKYDVPIILTSHYFTPDGSLSDESRASTSTYGDTVLSNGQIQPYLAVEPRKYRFTLLNAAVSRAFNLTIFDGSAPIPMAVIGSDGGFRQAPSSTTNLMIGMADRWEIIVDFASLSGKNVTLTTKNMWTDTAYSGMDDVLRFVVGKNVSDENANARLTRQFNLDLKFPSDVKVAAERTFDLKSHMDTTWGLNQYHMDDPMSRVMMRPPLGTVEKYTFKSSGMHMTTAGRTGSSDPLLKPASSPGGMGGMSGMHGGRGMVKRQMNGMMGGGSGGISMKDASWTHAMHLHLVVSTCGLASEPSSLRLTIVGYEARFEKKGRPIQSGRT